MSTVTTNFGLTKPASIEQFNLATYNNNLDLTDAAILSEAHKVQHVEYVRQGHVAATGVIGPGDLSTFIDSAASKNYSDWATSATDQVTISKEGIYAVSWKIVPNTTVSFWHSVSDSGGTAGGATIARSQLISVTASDSYWTSGGSNFYVPPAGLIIIFKFSLSAGATINHRIKLTKLK